MPAETKSHQSALIYGLIGERIRRLRKVIPLTQKTLADAVGIARASIANIELGRQRVSVELLYRLGRALGQEPRDLLPSSQELATPAGIPKRLAQKLDPQERAWLERLTAEAPAKGGGHAVPPQAAGKEEGH